MRAAGEVAEHGDVAVELPEQPDLLRELAAVRSERRAEVVQLQPEILRISQLAARDGQRRSDPLGPSVPPAAHHVVALLERLEEARDLLREVLEVRVERDQDLAARRVEPRLQRRGLAVVARQVDHAQARLPLEIRPHHRQRVVPAAVVHEDELEAVAVARAARSPRGPAR